MPFKNWIKQTHSSLVKENQGRVSLFVGKKGAGKSWAKISLADGIMNGGFDVEKDISYFEPWKFVNLLKTAPRGSVLILDDAGLAISAREWNSRSNIYLSHIFQTCRATNLWILISTPCISLIDKNLRSLLDDYIIVKGFNKKTGKVLLDWRIPNRNHFDGSVFWNQLRIQGKTFGKIFLDKPKNGKGELYDKFRSIAWDRVLAKSEDVQTGRNKGITIPQASVLSGLSIKKISEMIANNQIPQQDDSETLKVPLMFVKDMVSILGNLKGKQTKISSDERSTIKQFVLPNGEFLRVY